MDDDPRNLRKPPQRFYTPGSGPLKKSSPGFENSMENIKVDHLPNETRGRGQGRFRHHNERHGENENYRGSDRRKPGQQFYPAKVGNDRHDENGGGSRNSSPSRRRSHERSRNYAYKENRGNRQYSEPRSISPSHHQPSHDYTYYNRNRDTKSMETSSQRGFHVGKPPSGRRNSSGYGDAKPNKFIQNIDNLPPRFRKLYLAETGQHSLDSNIDYDNTPRENYHNRPIQINYTPNAPPPSWSQTLPTRGRGRARENFDRAQPRHYDSLHSSPSGSSLNLNDVNHDRLEQHRVGYGGPVPWRKDRNYQNIMSNGEISKNREPSLEVKDNKQNDSCKNNTLTAKDTNNSNNNIEQLNQDNHNATEDVTDGKSEPETEWLSLDWTVEVERSLKMEDLNICQPAKEAVIQSKPIEQQSNHEAIQLNQDQTQEASRRGKSKRKYRRIRSGSKKRSGRHRSSSRNKRDKSADNTKNVNHNHNELQRRDSGQMEMSAPRHRERRDSHISNRSSNYGSRDDLDKWRSWRSYSREPSLDRKILSQNNSREPSRNRAPSPKTVDGFRVPQAQSGHSDGRRSRRERGGGSWSRGPSAESGSRSPSRRHGGRRHDRPAHHNNITTNWREQSAEISSTNERIRKLSASSTERERKTSFPSSSGPPPGLLVLPLEVGHRNVTSGNQKTLFDHNNPSKPILLQQTSQRERMDPEEKHRQRSLLSEVQRGEAQLVLLATRGVTDLIHVWPSIIQARQNIQNILQRLLVTEMKFCQSENIEHHFWKILYHNFIEMMRKSLNDPECTEKEEIKAKLHEIIEEGTKYFEDLVELLENSYKFKVEDYLNANHLTTPKGLGFTGLALISVQKIYLFLGDLARYKELINSNEKSNFGKAKNWYTKAQQINPKNGRPYNQLAVLAMYAGRKLDAVYYYTRSLMSSNSFHSARESLIDLFDKNRKTFESWERRRRTERHSSCGGTSGMRKEVWVRHDQDDDSYLKDMTTVELNKTFNMTYLHVHGKLITKIGMETFHESASLMLRQFRELLSQQPLPTTSNRLLQLTALNMFAVEMCTAPHQRDSTSESSSTARSPWLECALSVALLMLGVMLERACALLPEPSTSQQYADATLMLPAIKVWCDWMLCHGSVWNPPPNLNIFELGNNSDPWDWFAKFMNTLDKIDDKSIEFSSEPKEGYSLVRLEEDVAMAGFTPLMFMEAEPAYAPKHVEQKETILRVRRLTFFGWEYLCGTEPPVLLLRYAPPAPVHLVSAVVHAQPVNTTRDEETLQDVSEDEEDQEAAANVTGVDDKEPEEEEDGGDEATRRLLRRRTQLEQRRKNMEQRKQRKQEIIRSSAVNIELEVRPKWLVPDTNCFIDHLVMLQRAAEAQPYTLAVPIVVVSELEGLSKCTRVGNNARAALDWLTPDGSNVTGVRFVTSRGSLLPSGAYTAEQREPSHTNDDRVLHTALSLHQANPHHTVDEISPDGVKRLVCEVVLLTDDRNLRVKALAANLPARDLRTFCQWANLN